MNAVMRGRALAAALSALIALAACVPATPSLTEEQVRLVAENMARAWSQCDYEAFSRDWTDRLKDMADGSAWTSHCEETVGSNGTFESIDSVEFVPSGAATAERWKVTVEFENGTEVQTLDLRPDGLVDHYTESFGQRDS